MEAENDPNRYFNPQQAAAYTKMSLSWLRKRTAAREIPHIKLGRRVVYDRHDLDEYMEQQKVETVWRRRDDARR